MNNTVWEQHFDEPIFQLIRKIQDDVFNTLIPLEVRTINCFKGPMVVYTECYDPYRHTILINVEGNYPYQAAYQYSHEYSHIKMQFWKTYGYAEYLYNFFEEALAFCASIWTLRQLGTYPESIFTGIAKPQLFLEYANDTQRDAEQSLDIENPKIWWEENFLLFQKDFSSKNTTVTDEERKRANRLGTFLLPLACRKGFWTAAGCLTTALASQISNSGKPTFPATSVSFFSTWTSGCTPDGSDAVQAIRNTLI